MLGLTAQRRSFDIVISDLSRCKRSVGDFIEELGRCGFVYYLITHDKDVDNQGALIRPHLHLVLVSSKTLRVKQLINLLVDSFLTNAENVQVQEVISLAGSIQYLLHLNDSNKFQYSKESIITNDSDNLDGYLLESPKLNKLTTERLFELIFEDNLPRLELIRTIGIASYTHYIRVIDELYDIRKIRS